MMIKKLLAMSVMVVAGLSIVACSKSSRRAQGEFGGCEGSRRP